MAMSRYDSLVIKFSKLNVDLYGVPRYKITSNTLVTLVAAKENCFHEPFKTIKTVGIPKFIWQRVPDCRAGVVERPTAVRAESTARHSETVQVDRSTRSMRGWDSVVCEVLRETFSTADSVS